MANILPGGEVLSRRVPEDNMMLQRQAHHSPWKDRQIRTEARGTPDVTGLPMRVWQLATRKVSAVQNPPDVLAVRSPSFVLGYLGVGKAQLTGG
jgi:hypothetical protein